MSQICRVRKIGKAYFPAFPDGFLMNEDVGYSDPVLAYEVAEDVELGYRIEGEPNTLSAREAVRALGMSSTSSLNRKMSEEPRRTEPWHDVNGRKIRFAVLSYG